ncbi:MAG: carboxypeptidase regulatory-like domain-containing protein [FCB group bacterium]
MKFSFYFRRFIIPALFTLMLIAVACKENPTTPTNANTITGVLKDEQNNGVPNAILQVNSGTAAVAAKLSTDTTDEDGNYTLSGLPEDISTLDVTINHPDFKPVTSNLKKLTGTAKTNCLIKVLHLDSCCGRIEITVYKQADSTPVYNAEFRLKRGTVLIRKAYTNESGKLVFEHVCLGDYNYRIAKDGLKVIEGSLNVPSCDSNAAYRNSFYMATNLADSCCNGQITFTAKDSVTNSPIANMDVKLWKGNQLLSDYKTGDNGQIIFTHICPGDYQISASNDHYKGIEFTFSMTCNDTVSYTKYFVLRSNSDSCCNGIIKVIPKDKNSGAILNGATVNLYQGDKLLQTKTVENGYALFNHICTGDYSLDILMAHYKHLEFAISMTCNDTLETTKSLEPEVNSDSCCHGQITFNVADSTTGNPLGQVLVKLYKSGTFLCQYTTGDKGQIIFTNICPGNYKITGDKDGYKELAFEFTMGCNDNQTFNKKMLKIQSADTCCKGVITFNVTDSTTGKPLSHVTVDLWKGNTKLSEYITGDLGTVNFKQICEGEYKISASKDGYHAIDFTFTMGCNDNKTFNKAMLSSGNNDSCCNGVITFNVKDSTTGNPLGQVLVKLYKSGTFLCQYTTGDNGQIIFNHICPGNYKILGDKDGYKELAFEFTMGCNDNQTFNKVMAKNQNSSDSCCNGQYKIIPRDKSTNEVLNGAVVKIYQGDKLLATETVENGYALFTKLCKGSYNFDITYTHYTHIDFTDALECNQSKELTEYMQKEGGVDTCYTAELDLKIMKDGSDLVIPDAKVDIYLHDQLIQTVYSNNEGWAKALNLMAPATYAVHISKDGYVTKIVNFTYTGCNTISETVKITKQ